MDKETEKDKIISLAVLEKSDPRKNKLSGGNKIRDVADKKDAKDFGGGTDG